MYTVYVHFLLITLKSESWYKMWECSGCSPGLCGPVTTSLGVSSLCSLCSLITLGLLTSNSQFSVYSDFLSLRVCHWMSELTPQLSLVTSEEYKQWKSDTLATQNSHNVEIVQLQESERKKVSSREFRLSLHCGVNIYLSGCDPEPW